MEKDGASRSTFEPSQQPTSEPEIRNSESPKHHVLNLMSNLYFAPWLLPRPPLSLCPIGPRCAAGLWAASVTNGSKPAQQKWEGTDRLLPNCAHSRHHFSDTEHSRCGWSKRAENRLSVSSRPKHKEPTSVGLGKIATGTSRGIRNRYVRVTLLEKRAETVRCWTPQSMQKRYQGNFVEAIFAMGLGESPQKTRMKSSPKPSALRPTVSERFL